MSYDIHCELCPYYRQKHLNESVYFSNRLNPPIELEDNHADILLVFQAPGEEEWLKGEPIQPIKKPGGTAGSRIQASWDRTQKNRSCFDIINSVQCFPGKVSGKRDFEPDRLAVDCCSNRLLSILKLERYTKIITFGKLAFGTVTGLACSNLLKIKIVNAPHPNGGVNKTTLDALW